VYVPTFLNSIAPLWTKVKRGEPASKKYLQRSADSPFDFDPESDSGSEADEGDTCQTSCTPGGGGGGGTSPSRHQEGCTRSAKGQGGRASRHDTNQPSHCITFLSTYLPLNSSINVCLYQLKHRGRKYHILCPYQAERDQGFKLIFSAQGALTGYSPAFLRYQVRCLTRVTPLGFLCPSICLFHMMHIMRLKSDSSGILIVRAKVRGCKQ
jgi:hypothetical protein